MLTLVLDLLKFLLPVIVLLCVGCLFGDWLDRRTARIRFQRLKLYRSDYLPDFLRAKQ